MRLHGQNPIFTAGNGIARILAVVAVWIGLAIAPQHAEAVSGVDVMVVFDESGSSEVGEFDWLETAIPQLDTELSGLGISDNRYGLMSFGMFEMLYSAPTSTGHQQVYLGLSSISDYVDAFSKPIPHPGIGMPADPELRGYAYEDGYAALYDAAMLFDRGDDIARIIIFVSDEDRDDLGYIDGLKTQQQINDGVTDYDIVAQKLIDQNVIVNSLVSVDITSNEQPGYAIQIDPEMTAYYLDGATAPGLLGPVVNAENTIVDYVGLTWLTGGSVFDIAAVRSENPDTVAAFTERFIQTKIDEITIPAPTSAASAAMLLCFAAWRTRRRE